MSNPHHAVNRELYASNLVRPTRRALLQSALCTGVSLGLAGIGLAQDAPNSSLYSGRLPVAARSATTAAEPLPAPARWYELPLPPPKEIKVHDLVTIRVDLGARVSSDAMLQRRRTAQYDARLNDWLILDGLRSAKPAPQSDGDQRVQGNLNELDRAIGQLDTTESMKFEITATVAAILPNGNLVLEAHQVARSNNEQWMQSLSGVCRPEDIGPGNVVLSRNIANLHVEKKELGQIRDSYKRGWLTRWWDQFGPF
jgi:flagellar L-ring protein FlgH